MEDWKRCFGAFDQDGSGSIDRKEMGNALRAFGYNLSDGFVNLLINKFDKYGEIILTLTCLDIHAFIKQANGAKAKVM